MHPDEIDYEALAKKLAQQVEDLNVKLFERSIRGVAVSRARDALDWIGRNPVRFMMLVGLFYMTTVWAHAHYNMWRDR